MAAAQEPARRPPRRSRHQRRRPARRCRRRRPARRFAGVHASPGVRRLARELGVDLTKVRGPGEKGRITKDDVIAGVRAARCRRRPPRQGGGIPEIPAQDFSKFGPIETKPLVAHQAAVRPAPAPLLAQRPARHPRRRGRHHRPRRLPQGTRRRRQGEGLPRHAAGLPDEGQRLGAQGVPRSSTARCRRRRTR